MKSIRICPKCKSVNIGLEWKSLWFFGFPPSYKCTHCGYAANLFPELIIKSKTKSKLKKAKSKRK